MSHIRALRGSVVLGLIALAALLALVTGCNDSQINAVNLPLTRTLTLTLSEVSSTGTVLPTKVNDAVVTLTPPNGTVSVVNGVATITLLQDGTYTVTVTSPTHTTTVRTFVVAVPKGSSGVDQALSLNMSRKATEVAVTSAAAPAVTAPVPTVVKAEIAGETVAPASMPTLTLQPSTTITVNGVVPTAPVEISVTPVPTVAAPTVATPVAEGQTTESSTLSIGGFVLEPQGLQTNKPMTMKIPIASLDIDAAFAAANSPFDMEDYDPGTGVSVPFAGQATWDGVDSLVFTISNFSTGAAFTRQRGAGVSMMRRLLLRYRLRLTALDVTVGRKTGTAAGANASLTFTTTFSADQLGAAYLDFTLSNMGFLGTMLGSTMSHTVVAPGKANNLATVVGKQTRINVILYPRNSSTPVTSGYILTHAISKTVSYKAVTTGITGGG